MTQPPNLNLVENGYYALVDPDPETAGRMTYWRRLRTPTSNAIRPWPASSSYGPRIPRRSELPVDADERAAFIVAFSTERWAYLELVVTAIAADPEAAAQRFARLGVRCCMCGQALKDPVSRAFGIGPDCRKAMVPAHLARFRTPDVDRVQAEHETTEPAGEAQR